MLIDLLYQPEQCVLSVTGRSLEQGLISGSTHQDQMYSLDKFDHLQRDMKVLEHKLWPERKN